MRYLHDCRVYTGISLLLTGGECKHRCYSLVTSLLLGVTDRYLQLRTCYALFPRPFRKQKPRTALKLLQLAWTCFNSTTTATVVPFKLLSTAITGWLCPRPHVLYAHLSSRLFSWLCASVHRVFCARISLCYNSREWDDFDEDEAVGWPGVSHRSCLPTVRSHAILMFSADSHERVQVQWSPNG